MQDIPFLYRTRSPIWKKLLSFGIQVLYSERMTFILYAHTHTEAARGLGFSIV